MRGSGAYFVKGRKIGGGRGVPQFGGGNGSCTISHREFVEDIELKAGGTFNPYVYHLNPALPQSAGSPFPWLPPIASQFEEYKIKGMLFTFKTTASTFTGGATNPALGQVVMATQYNAMSQPFTTKSQMEQYQGAVSGVLSRDLTHGVECARRETPVAELWTRSGGVGSQDLRLYDHGIFQLVTQGGNSASDCKIGELWVTYKIQFFKPKLNQSSDVNSDHFILP